MASSPDEENRGSFNPEPSPNSGSILDIEEAERRYLAGESSSTIARSYGVTKQAVQQALKRRGTTFAIRRAHLDARIARMAREGKTIPAIASDVGYTTQTVRAAVLRLGLTPTWEPPRYRSLSEETLRTIMQMRAKGHTIGEIADATGASRSAISARLIQAGKRSQIHGAKRKSAAVKAVPSKGTPDEAHPGTDDITDDA